MNAADAEPLKPRRLLAGDRVRLVSPASTPTANDVQHLVSVLESEGFVVEIGEHALDTYGYLAGKDEHRLADLNDALRDPGVRSVVATRGGKGAYRIADGMDFAAARRNRSLLVGFSENTILHLALFKNAGLSGIHGGIRPSSEVDDGVIAAMTTPATTVVHRQNSNPTNELTTTGVATGHLIGGNQDMIASASGWMLPSFENAIVLLEAVDMRLGHIDRQLNMLEKTKSFASIAGFAVGAYFKCGGDSTTQGDWRAVDVLYDRLSRYAVPILGGLPIGHGPATVAVPHGTAAVLDADAGILTVESAVT